MTLPTATPPNCLESDVEASNGDLQKRGDSVHPLAYLQLQAKVWFGLPEPMKDDSPDPQSAVNWRQSDLDCADTT